MAHTRNRRRIVLATIVSGALLVVGPAVYGVAMAQTRVDGPTSGSSGNLDGSNQTSDPDGTGDGSGTGNGSGSSGNDQSSSSPDPGDEQQNGQAPQNGTDSPNGTGDGSGQDVKNGQNGNDGQKDENGQKNKDGADAKPGGSGLDVLATDCSGSKLAPHDGFQKAPRCVSTAFGEVGSQDQNPSLLITDAPGKVKPGESFQLKVSTRNLVRDRFLAAGQGGYYKESSLLNAQGLQRGHFHTACRILPSTDEAPDAAPAPAFFLATEDGSGSATPDTVTIDVPGVDQSGTLQCASWAGDGSHRIPMMQRADQTPAFDSVRIKVG